MDCPTTPFTPEQSPYGRESSPYSGGAAPYARKLSPFSAVLSPFSAGAFCPVLLYPEDGFPVLFDDGVTIEL